MNEHLKEQVERMVGGTNGQFGRQKWTFTLESGRGTTYANSSPVLYGHSTYGRGSVLAGRPLRQWIEGWDTWEQARKELAELKKVVKRFKYEDFGEQGGTTHIPLNQMLAGIPDDSDY